MSGSEKLVDIEAFGTRYRVKTDSENEQSIKRAVLYLEKKVEEFSGSLSKPVTGAVPEQLFFAVLDITVELLVLREQVENDKESKEEQIARLGRIVDKLLVSKFVKIRMAYGAERRGN